MCIRGSYRDPRCANATAAVLASTEVGESGVVIRVRLTVVSIATGREIAAIECGAPVRCAALSPDASSLALAYGDARVEVFALDAATSA